jgi:YD repeat-containing protein
VRGRRHQSAARGDPERCRGPCEVHRERVRSSACQVEMFAYYSDGQLKTRTDFNGHTTTFAYDGAGRLVTRTPDAFFASEVPITFTYWPSGRRKTMVDVSGTTTYTYDARNRLLTKVTPEGTLAYTYDVAGNRRTVQSESATWS